MRFYGRRGSLHIKLHWFIFDLLAAFVFTIKKRVKGQEGTAGDRKREGEIGSGRERGEGGESKL